jgi:hypothetical protein
MGGLLEHTSSHIPRTCEQTTPHFDLWDGNAGLAINNPTVPNLSVPQLLLGTIFFDPQTFALDQWKLPPAQGNTRPYSSQDRPLLAKCYSGKATPHSPSLTRGNTNSYSPRLAQAKAGSYLTTLDQSKTRLPNLLL